MKKNYWKKAVAVIGIVSILASNTSEYMVVNASGNITSAVSAQTSESLYNFNPSDAVLKLAGDINSNNEISLTGVCMSDGKILSGYQKFMVDFKTNSDEIDMSETAPDISGYTFENASIDGSPVKKIRKFPDENTGEILIQYSSSSDSSSEWTDISKDTEINFNYKITETVNADVTSSSEQSTDETAVSVHDKNTDSTVESPSDSDAESDNKTSFNYEDDNIIVTAELEKAGAVPSDANLVVTPVTPETKGYNYTAYMQALNDKADDISGISKGTEFTADNTLLYDIAFMSDKKDENGNVIAGEKQEYEPDEGTVKVTMTFKKHQLSSGIDVKSSDDLVITHLPVANESANETSEVKSATDETAITAKDIDVNLVSGDMVQLNKNGEDKAGFSLDKFSLVSFSRVPTLLGTPSPASNGYVVTNTAYNYAGNDKTTYKLSADASVTIGNDAAISVAAGGTVDVPANGTMKINPVSTSQDMVVTMQPVSGQSAIGESSVTFGTNVTSFEFKSQEAIENLNLIKKWNDGASDTKPDISSLLKLQYCVQDSNAWTDVNKDTISVMGYSSVPVIAKNETSSNNTTWVYSFSKELNEYAVSGDDAGKTVTYRLAETSAPAGYKSSYETDSNNSDTILTNTKLNPYNATKKWADGNNAYGTRPAINEWINILNERGGAKRTSLFSEDTKILLTATDKEAEGYIEIKDNNGIWSISMPNSLGYDSENAPYIYSIDEGTNIQPANKDNVTDATVYEPVYVNQGNYASKMDALYTGGTVTNTLADTTEYKADKVWKDDNESSTIKARPKAKFDLYRFPDKKGESYEKASPVAGLTLEMVPAVTGSTSSYKVQAAEGSVSLPEYNEDGYKYIYFAKETLSGGENSYEQIFVKNGSISGNDKFLFNGGELDNTITGTVSMEAVKKWDAAARQDIDAKVTMSVFQTDPDTKEEKHFADKTLTGFGTENVSKTANFTDLPMYNSEGHKYKYEIKETSLQTENGSEFKDCTFKTINGQNYFITADGYRYRQTTTTDNQRIEIVNTLVGNAEVVIDKTFTNGLLASPTTLTYTIYCNGNEIGTKTAKYEGNVDGKSFKPDQIVIKSYEDLTTRADAYASATGLLPRYDDKGAIYKYTVQETKIDSAATYGTTCNNKTVDNTYAADDKNYAGEKYSQAIATVSNYKPGDGVSIRVHKKWIDADDTLFRQPVHVELQYTSDGKKWEKAASGTINTDTDYVEIGVPDAYKDKYKSWVSNKKPQNEAGAFRVVETALGTNSDYPVVSDGDKSITEFAGNSGHQSGWSFVSTPEQNYDVSPVAAVNSDNDFTITNVRVGVEKISLIKNWVDGNNEKKSRPESITFTVTASEAVFDGGTASKDFEVKPDADGIWKLDTEWFQKYDHNTGEYISYSIAEKGLNYAEGAVNYTSQYSRSWDHAGDGLGYVVGKNHTGDIDTYKLTNALGGSVYPVLNKYWKDAADAETIAKRPDIYPVLIRSYKDASGKVNYEKMTYQDRDWKTKVINDNWWQCSFVAQPRYNASGYEYTYYIAEEFSSVILNDYMCTGGYSYAPDDSTGKFTEDSSKINQLKKSDTGLDKDYYVAQLYETDNTDGTVTSSAGTIVNKPVADRTISGTKIWSQLPIGFGKKYLPDVNFKLMRYLSTQTAEDAVEVQDEQSVSTTATLKSGTTAFSFEGKYPRYNDDGIPYIYIVKETSPEDVGLAFKITNDIKSGLVVTNEFKNDQNYTINFDKVWSGVPDGTVNPSSTITLVRYLTDGNGGIITGSRNAIFATSASNGNINAVTADCSKAGKGTNGKVNTISWNHLAYYGPNGNPYVYKIEETNVPNGYVVYDSNQTTPISSSTIGTKTGYIVDVDGTTYDKEKMSGTSAAGITNKYGDVTGHIKATKTWKSDKTYAISPRTKVTLKLWRWTEKNTTPEHVGGDITAESPASGDVWSEEIQNLQIYAPDGSEYKYGVTEGEKSSFADITKTAASQSTAPEGYTVAVTSAVKPEAGTAVSSSASSTIGVTNTAVLTSLDVTKTWEYKTGTGNVAPTDSNILFDTGLAGTPEIITYRFKYSTDEGTTWSDLNGTDGKPVEKSVTETSAGKFNTVTLNSLPVYIIDQSGTKAVKYEAYEYSVKFKNKSDVYLIGGENTGNIEVSESGTTTSGKNTKGTTSVTNTVPMKVITITKTWDDEKNRDGKRTKLTFTVTRGKVWSDTDSAAAEVTLDVPASGDTSSVKVYVPENSNYDQKVKSTYSVSEKSGLNSEYTVTGCTDGSNYIALTQNSIDLEENGSNAYFKNTKPKETITINSAKKWVYNSVPYTGAEGVTVPTELQKYLSSLKNISFTLQYKDGINGTWTNVPENSEEFGNVVPTQSVTVTPSTGKVTTATWEKLPRNNADENVSAVVTYYYRIVETLDEGAGKNWAGSSAEVNGADAKITSSVPAEALVTNTLNLTSINVTKKWNDSDNKYNTRPGSIIYKVLYSKDSTDGIDGTWTAVPDLWLQSDFQNAKEGLVTSANADFSITLKNLPEYTEDGIAYKYRAEEYALNYTVDGQTKTVTPGENALYSSTGKWGSSSASYPTFTEEFTNALATTSLTAVKTWSDDKNICKMRPVSITFKVQSKLESDSDDKWADYKPLGQVVTFTSVVAQDDAGTITGGLTDLPKYDINGGAIQYRAVEDSFQYSDKTTAKRSGNIIGTYTAAEGDTEYKTDTNTFTTAVSNTVDTGSIVVSKIWSDDENRDNVRPDKVTVNLSASAGGKNITLPAGVSASADITKESAWKNDTTWKTVPIRSEGGSLITYKLTETVPTGYTASYKVNSGASATGNAASVTVIKGEISSAEFSNTYKPIVQAVKATKTWSDNAAYGDRPSSVEFTLNAKYKDASGVEQSYKVEKDESGTSITNPQKVTIAYDKTSGSITWSNLPEYRTGLVGHQITYYVTETKLNNDGYTVEGNNSLSVTNKMDETSLKVNKIWDDSYGIAGTVLNETFKLQRSTDNGTTWQDVKDRSGTGNVVTADADKVSGTVTFSNLPKYDVSDNAYIYRAVETKITLNDAEKTIINCVPDASDETKGVVGGFTYSAVTSGNSKEGFVTDVTNKTDTGEISVGKIWDDTNNLDKIRPESVRFTLKASVSGKEIVLPSGVSSGSTLPMGDGSWTDNETWKSVPVKDAAGNTITYTVTETVPTGYTASYKVNSGESATGNAASVNLTQGGTSSVKFTNSILVKSLTAEKIWKDANDKYGLRPSKIVFKVESSINGTEWNDFKRDKNTVTFTSTVGTDGTITGEIQGLPDNDVNGNKLQYRAAEQSFIYDDGETAIRNITSIGAYTVTDSTTECLNDKYVTSVTNALDVGNIDVSKSWNDKDDRDKIRPASIKLELTALAGGNKFTIPSSLAEVILNEKNNWSDNDTWAAVPTKDRLGKSIVYTVTEKETNGYKASYNVDTAESSTGNAAVVTPEKDGTYSVSFTNTLMTTSLTAQKTWSDYNNKFNLRPESILFKVQKSIDGNNWSDFERNGKTVTFSSKVGTDGKITGNISDLPRIDADGRVIKYRALEQQFSFKELNTVNRSENYIGAYTAAEGETNYSSEDNTYTTQIINTIDTGAIAVTKTWSDENNRDGIRPEKAELNLTAYVENSSIKLPTGVTGSTILSEQNNWKDDTTWNILPLRNYEGRTINYDITETAIKGYTASYKIDGTENTVISDSAAVELKDGETSTINFSNTHKTVTFNLKAEKIWEDESDKYNTRPEKMIYTLQFSTDKNTWKTVDKTPFNRSDAVVTLDPSKTSDNTWEKLPAFLPGSVNTKVYYRVVETPVDGYGTSYDKTFVSGSENGIDASDQKITVTNTMNSFVINKTGVPGKSLEGTKFTVKRADDKVTVYTWIIGKDISDTVNGKLAVGKEYVVSEEPVPGYYPAHDIYIKMDNDGKVSESSLLDGDYKEVKNNTLNIVNHLTTFGMIKFDENEKELGGATFEITGVFANGTGSETRKLTLKNGHGSFEDGTLVSGNRYKISESTAPYRYQKINDFEVVLNDNGKLASVGELPEGVKLDRDTVIVKDKLIVGDIAFDKYINGFETGYNGAKNIRLPGVTFGIYTDKAADGVPKNTAVSDSEGCIRFSNVIMGTYYIKEISAPELSDGRIVLDKTIYKVNIDENGKASGLAAAEYDTATDTDAVETEKASGTAELVNDVVRCSFDVKKVDKADTSKVISGSKYNLYRVENDTAVEKLYGITSEAGKSDVSGIDKTLVETAVTDESGMLHFTGLITGVTYVLKEIEAPKGSQVSENPVTIKFAVDAVSGKAKIQTVDTGNGTIEANVDGTFTWLEPPTQVSIKKVNKNGQGLAGAVLRITDMDGNVIVPDWTTSIAEPKLISGILDAGKQYKLIEVSAPDGYEKAEDIIFTVDKKDIGPSDSDVENSVQKITMTDIEKTSVKGADVKIAGKSVSAKTGDNENPFAYYLLLISSAAMIAFTFNKKRTNSEK